MYLLTLRLVVIDYVQYMLIVVCAKLWNATLVLIRLRNVVVVGMHFASLCQHEESLPAICQL